jgi:hypothetical protein
VSLAFYVKALLDSMNIGANSLRCQLLTVLQCLKDVDYVPKPKLLFENLLNAEFKEPVDKGFFYTGRSLNFDSN